MSTASPSTATSGGAIIARCVVCRIGFVITSETAETGRANMITHLDAVHGAGL
jgi:hypothetical protein